MYRCSLCGHVSLVGQPRLVHVIERQVPRVREITVEGTGRGRKGRRRKVVGVVPIEGTRTEIVKEIEVCSECKNLLREGVPLQEVSKSMCRKRIKDARQEESIENPSRRRKDDDWTSQAVPLKDVRN